MAQNPYLSADKRVVIAAAQTVLPFPPTSYGITPSWWATPPGDGLPGGFISEGELEVFAAGAANLSDAELLGATPQPIVIDDIELTDVDHTANTVTKVDHTLETGDGPVTIANIGGALPTGYVAGTQYYAIKVDDDVLKLAASREDALAGIPVELTADGTGANTISDVDDQTTRLFWLSMGLLGHLKDGAVELTARRGYRTRFGMSGRAMAYAVVATLSSPVEVSAVIYPLV